MASPKQLTFIQTLQTQITDAGSKFPAAPANLVDGNWKIASAYIDVLKEAAATAKDVQRSARRVAARATGGQADWTPGKHTFEATVEKVAWKDSDFGGKYEVHARLADGRQARFTFVSKLHETYEPHCFVGARVSVTAQIAPWARDETVGFGKRPNVTVLNPEDLLTSDEVAEARAAWRTLYVTEGQPRETVRYSCQHGHTNEKAWEGRGPGYTTVHHNEVEKLGHRCGQTVQVMSDVWESCGEIITLPTEIRSDALVHHYPAPQDDAVVVAWFRALPQAEKTYLAARKANGWSDHGYGFDHWAHGLGRMLGENPERANYFSIAG